MKIKAHYYFKFVSNQMHTLTTVNYITFFFEFRIRIDAVVKKCFMRICMT